MTCRGLQISRRHTTRLGRLRPAAWLAAVALVLGSAVATGVAAASPAGAPSYAFCPPARHIVTGSTSWRHHRLGPGIHLAATSVGKGIGRLKVNVVRVNLASRRVKVAPLHRAITSRHRLSRLAHRPRLVAATNASYFDYGYGAPKVPLIGRGGPLVLSRHHASVVGVGDDGRARQVHVWLNGHAKSARGRHRLVGLNDVTPARGLSLYTSSWGRQRVPMPPGARSLAVRHGRALAHASRRLHVPRHGDLLLATGRSALRWIKHVRRGGSVLIGYRAASDVHHAFQQAYGVGTHVVGRHHLRTGLYCRRGEIYAARTDIAWAQHKRQLILATVDSPHGSSGYGVDENQMSQIMVAVGAEESYALDGGGSTELLAKLPHDGRLSIRTHTRSERPIPVGIGVSTLPKPPHRKHHHGRRHHKHHHGQKNPIGGIIGGLLHH